MINEDALFKFVGTIPTHDPQFQIRRKHMWEELLSVSEANSPEHVIEQVALGSAGNFNFWEGDEGGVVWPKCDGADWLRWVRGDSDVKLNLMNMRQTMVSEVTRFMALNGGLGSEVQEVLADEIWWLALTHAFGGDPLRKRETLMWIILSDLNYLWMPVMPCPNKGCIDYNIILLFRKLGIVTGYQGSFFGVYEETKLRLDCLHAVEGILSWRPDLTVSELDAFLWYEGKQIRHTFPREQWEPYFCYRFGCYFY